VPQLSLPDLLQNRTFNPKVIVTFVTFATLVLDHGDSFFLTLILLLQLLEAT
jgi:threonine/homoserine/homoserine lactone efflux protein